jgi:hypothetical protein
MESSTTKAPRDESPRQHPFDAFRALRGTIDAPLLQWLAEEKAAERQREDARAEAWAASVRAAQMNRLRRKNS